MGYCLPAMGYCLLSSTGIVIDLGLLGLLWVTKYCRRTGHNSLPSRCEWTRVDSLAF